MVINAVHVTVARKVYDASCGEVSFRANESDSFALKLLRSIGGIQEKIGKRGAGSLVASLILLMCVPPCEKLLLRVCYARLLCWLDRRMTYHGRAALALERIEHLVFEVRGDHKRLVVTERLPDRLIVADQFRASSVGDLFQKRSPVCILAEVLRFLPVGEDLADQSTCLLC